MDFENLIRSATTGLVLMVIAFAVLIGANYLPSYISEAVQSSTGLSDVSLIALLMLVFLVGFAASSKVEQDIRFDGGGTKKRFFPKAGRPVVTSVQQNRVEEIECEEDGYVTFLRERTEQLAEDTNIILKIMVKPKLEHKRDTILYYIEKLSQFPNFKYVAFVNRHNRFMFFAKASELKKEIETIQGAYIIDLLNANRFEELKMEPFINHHQIFNNRTNMYTLEMMARKKINEVMVVSRVGNRIVDVLDIQSLVRGMILQNPHAKKGKQANRGRQDGQNHLRLVSNEDGKEGDNRDAA